MAEVKKITWSHSRLKTLFENPAEYFLKYEEGISPKQEKAALSTGSAVHWLLEHGTTDLTEYYKTEKGPLLQWNDYSDEQCLAESLAEAYFRKKPEIYKAMLLDPETGKVLDILEEEHELQMTMEFPSKLFKEPHSFLGIVDLLLLTEKGWILVDYKTGSKAVDWDDYKSQLYKYVHLIRKNLPEFPLWKICVIFLKKTNIRRRQNETDESYKNRIKAEYDLNADDYIELHSYPSEDFDEAKLKASKDSLIQMMDMAQVIINNKAFFCNYSNIVGQYGPSPYYDVFYKNADSHNLYTIRDMIFDEDENDVITSRNCTDLDLMCLERTDILNKYSLFKEEADLLTKGGKFDEEKILKHMRKKYLTDESLLKKYALTYKKGY